LKNLELTFTFKNEKTTAIKRHYLLIFQMSNRVEPAVSKARYSKKSTISSNSLNGSTVTIGIWILRIPLLIILFLFIMPIALLLTPWWILMQPFEKKCPNMMDSYYRIVTWPLTISKNIRSYRQNDRFIEQLKY